MPAPVIPNVTLNDSSSMMDYQSFLVPALAQVEQGITQKKYPTTAGYRAWLYVDTSISALAEFATRRVKDYVGGGGWDSTGNNAHHTGVEVMYDAMGLQIFQRSIPIRWNLFEIRQAAANFNAGGGLNLKGDKMTAVEDIIEREKNLLALYGDKTKKIEGLFNSEQVTVVTASMSIGDLVSLITLESGLQFVINFFAEYVNQVEFDQTNTIYTPNRILLPPKDYRKLSQAVVPLTSESILPKLEQALGLKFAPDLALVKGKFKPLGDLKFDELPSDRMVVGRVRDEEVARFILPMDTTWGSPFPEDDQNLKQVARMRTAGTEIKIPAAMMYVDLPADTKSGKSLGATLNEKGLAFNPAGELVKVKREGGKIVEFGDAVSVSDMQKLGLIHKGGDEVSESGFFKVTNQGRPGAYDVNVDGDEE
ncbi:TPA: DUF2184 domain-containing protein [Vibrio harveyi]|nr:DUF2184 domain-containing protein [Vibrio harveyi]HEQ3599243.1 DUF2184 domain-containing protein [Vibrio harveyi]HEQ3611301.1 DUF2184 domain-containing protein [Vibrio harveyi]